MTSAEAPMTDDLKSALQSLLKAPGLSGFEAPVRSWLEDRWGPLADEIEVSRLGSLHARKRGAGEEPRPTVLLAAHMDTIGLMVSDVLDGWLRVTEVGGVDLRVLPGLRVIVHGREDRPGLVVQPPTDLRPPAGSNRTVPLPHLLVDLGLPAREVARLVRPGDPVSFGQEPVSLSDDLLAAPYLDNRASVAALTLCFEELQRRKHPWDVIFAATTQEEETFAGARTSAFQIQPSLAVAVDVTFGASPGSPDHKTFALGKGLTNVMGPNLHPAVFAALRDAASRVEVPLVTEVTPRHSGTDAYALQTAREGIPTGLISIPLRYMHTPVELVSLGDIRRAGRLLAEFAAGLAPDFLTRITWD